MQILFTKAQNKGSKKWELEVIEEEELLLLNPDL